MYITIGKIVNTHGIRGEVKVKVFSDSIERFENVDKLFATADEAPEAKRLEFGIANIRYHKDMVLLTFKEIIDLTAAQKLKDYFLQVPRSDLPDLPVGKYYIFQLIGLQVWEGNVCFGRITDVMQPGSNDVYAVSDGKLEILIPALKSVIKSVDLEKGRMDVELPAGLLEIYQQK